VERLHDRPPDGRVLKTWAIRAAQLALTALVTWFIVSRVGVGVEELRTLDVTVWRPRPLPFLASTLLLALGYFVSAGIWGRIVSDLGGPKLPTRTSVPVFMVANLGRYVPGKIWQIAGLAALARGHGVPVTIATAAAVVGQGMALVAASALGALALFASPDPYPLWGTVTVGAITAGLALAAVPAVYGRVLGAWFRLARAERPADLTPGSGFLWLALYLVNWTIYAAAFVLLTISLGMDGPVLAVGSAFSAAYVLGYVMIFAPAGLGPREGFLIAFLTPHLGAGAAAVVAIAARLWTTAVEVVPAAGFWLLGGVRGSTNDR
jgi:glycosyltransferase 2 family protein